MTAGRARRRCRDGRVQGRASPARRRPLPAALAGVVVLLGPVLLAALVVTQTVGGDGQIVLDARLAGVGAAAAAIAARAPLPVVVVVAAAATALVRLLS